MTEDITSYCSHCGCHIKAHFPPKSSLMSRYFQSESDEITLINEEVLYVEKAIRFLWLKRSSILQRLNHVQSPSNILPAEVLACILEMVVTSHDDTSKQCWAYLLLKLSTVSTYWRYVVHSSPRLSTSACLEHSPQMGCKAAWRDRNIAVLQSYIERAKESLLPFSFKSLELVKSSSDTSSLFRPYCGCTNIHLSTAAAQISFKSKLDEIASINEEVSVIEKDIGVLQLERSSILERLNHAQSPPDTLPPEVLSYIFELVISSATHDNTNKECSTYIPLRLSAVSAYWRYTVRLTPQLWTSVHFQNLNRKEVTDAWREQKIALLRYYIERAKGLPLSFCFKALYNWKDSRSDTNSKAVVDVLLEENPTRIKSLQLISTMPINWFDSPRNDGDQIEYPHLEVLEVGLDNFYDTTNPLKLPVSPMLQRLKLQRSLCITPSFIGTKLTHLHLVEMPYMLSMLLLLLCKDTLVEYQCRKQLSFDPMGFKRVPFKHEEVITLPRLETLGWELTSYEQHVEWDRSLLVNFDMPALRHLYLIGRPVYSEQLELPQSNLFTRISSPLSTFGICPDYPVNVEEGRFDKYMDLMDTERLVVGSRFGKWKSIVESLDPLYTSDGRKRLPKLKVLSFPIPGPESPYHGWAEPYEDVDKCGDIAHMLKQRLLVDTDKHLLRVLQEPFILQLPRNKDGSGIRCRKDEERMKKLVDAGLLRVEVCDHYLDMRELGPFM